MAYNREKIQAELFELQDEKYRDFHSKLIPDMEKENIIGIRTPVLRKYAKQFAKTEDAAAFLQDIPHTYYEENNLHMMLITSIKEYDKCLKEIEKFLPYIDNWRPAISRRQNVLPGTKKNFCRISNNGSIREKRIRSAMESEC